ncbi:hypothetical protein SeLEV6574_g01236 [Synchytrium endobioticum]|uniref:Vta1 C-terminal domain-containing protein n=1 Tax=Synchytrium endobioticum TaxID=286115 RepID=A0A507DE41_9FUNG|nr:hypothetical protein SeLEV6574_g01236 [Synchytrium endobioticum]
MSFPAKLYEELSPEARKGFDLLSFFFPIDKDEAQDKPFFDADIDSASDSHPSPPWTIPVAGLPPIYDDVDGSHRKRTRLTKSYCSDDDYDDIQHHVPHDIAYTESPSNEYLDTIKKAHTVLQSICKRLVLQQQREQEQEKNADPDDSSSSSQEEEEVDKSKQIQVHVSHLVQVIESLLPLPDYLMETEQWDFKNLTDEITSHLCRHFLLSSDSTVIDKRHRHNHAMNVVDLSYSSSVRVIRLLFTDKINQLHSPPSLILLSALTAVSAAKPDAVLEGVLVHVITSPDFGKIQADMVQKILRENINQEKILESSAKHFHLPVTATQQRAGWNDTMIAVLQVLTTNTNQVIFTNLIRILERFDMPTRQRSSKFAAFISGKCSQFRNFVSQNVNQGGEKPSVLRDVIDRLKTLEVGVMTAGSIALVAPPPVLQDHLIIPIKLCTLDRMLADTREIANINQHSMAASLNPPDELKHISAYLQRSQELVNREPILSYFCKYYAVKLAIEKGTKSKEGKAFLLDLMDSLEKEKKELGTSEAITNDVVGYAHVENFALKIFLNADNEDRAGKASKKTAKTFLAASLFLELLRIFGDIEGEVDEKIKYSKFKAADIMKALREDRTPTAGPPDTFGQPDDGFAGGSATGIPPKSLDDAFGAYTETSPPSAGVQQYRRNASAPASPTFPSPPSQLPTHSDSNTPSTTYYQSPQFGSGFHAINQPPSVPSGPVSISSSNPYSYPPTTPTVDPFAPVARLPPTINNPLASTNITRPASTLLDANSGGSPLDAFQLDHKAIQNAQKMAKFAISALQYDDVTTAIDNLEKAVSMLKPLRKPR